MRNAIVAFIYTMIAVAYWGNAQRLAVKTSYGSLNRKGKVLFSLGSSEKWRREVVTLRAINRLTKNT